MKGEEYFVFYPNWTKALIIIGLPLLVGCGIWASGRYFWEPGLKDSQYIVSALIGIAVLYQCRIGFNCLFCLKTTIQLFDDGIDVHKNGVSTGYNWDDLEIKHYAFATTKHLKTKDNSSIAYLSDGLPNLELLVHGINESGA